MVEHWDDPLPLIQGTGDLRCFRRHIVDESSRPMIADDYGQAREPA